MKCIWKNSPDSNANKLCMDHGIQPPQAVQTCETSPCDTDCVDLSKVCRKNADFCQMSTYRYHCCKSCRQLFNEVKNKPDER
ncbi:hypothetical protein Ciccas_005646 [Cichlidogyrus casuarinus]|uniref:Uncharacterized protein n=1 Tax=Cichlidogyrus casuarinus TaxID=1844966 RepID=A0ABD2Q829_9PLAT